MSPIDQLDTHEVAGAVWPAAGLHARGVVGEFGARFVSHAGPWLHRYLGTRNSSGFGILMYHRVTEVVKGIERPSINVTPAQFRRQVEGLLKLGFVIWPLNKVLDFHRRGRKVMPWVTVLTFDDGFHSVYRHAWPVLREFGVPATVFLCTAYLDRSAPFPFDHWAADYHDQVPVESYRPLSTSECHEMAASGLIQFGAHTHTHQDFRNRPAGFHDDLERNVTVLRSLFHEEDVPFAFPYGTPRLGFADQQLVEAARSLDVTCGLTTESRLVSSGQHTFSWGRLNVFPWDNDRTLAAKLGGWYSWAPQLKQRMRIFSRRGRTDTSDIPAAIDRFSVDQETRTLVSIIVPTFNRAHWIGDAIRSLANQEVGGAFDWEVIVVDNASADDTTAAVHEAAKDAPVPVRYLRQEKPGDAPTRNLGIRKSAGQWLAFFDDDQIADPNWLLELMTAAAATDAKVVGGAVLLDLDEAQLCQLGPICRIALRETQLYPKLQPYCPKDLPGTGNALVARSVFDEIGSFDESMVNGGSDCDFFVRAREAGYSLWYAPQAVIRHRISEARLSPESFRWDALSGGAEHAGYFDHQKRGTLLLVVCCLARLVQALIVHVPRLVWAWLRNDRGGVMGRRFLLWRTEGYVRRTLSILAPKLFPQRKFFDSLDFRNSRSLCR